MRRANAQLQIDRRTAILEAAQRCFARSGFHQSSMQEICAEARMSPGNLYRYFPSKEALIAGICERDRGDAARDFAALDQAPDFFKGLEAMGRYYLVERPADEVALWTEIMAESRRNPEIAALLKEGERDVTVHMKAMLRRAAERGEILADIDFDSAVVALMAVTDGMMWRRAVDPTFDAEAALPAILKMVRCLLTMPDSVGAAVNNGERQ